MGSKKDLAVNFLTRWLGKRSMKVKIFLGILLAFCAIVILRYTITEPEFFYFASGSIHIAGLVILVYKLFVYKTCSGLSLKFQELNAAFLAIRLGLSIHMEGDYRTVFDCIYLLLTLTIIWLMRFRLKSSYIKEFDNMWLSFLVVPSAILAVLIHPRSPQYYWIARVIFAFTLYLETVAILPQIRYMQNAKMIETFTGYYVFALGISRFLALAYWIIHIYETGGRYLFFFGYGYYWMVVLQVIEFVQSFILADFCYYYIKSFMEGQLLKKMPV
ncbi:ER lumen protein-retaining receptor erd-2.2-like [Trifolium pratense]|uniref:ER lumen protein-retaining receptor erd-2.2-like n=1 Tax=Trifolium pratense TaxID=57577 RepID=UPI001E690121|nr:ER lumen protein-retaining receptor erd-2.2-like [Trifolium pratense]